MSVKQLGFRSTSRGHKGPKFLLGKWCLQSVINTDAGWLWGRAHSGGPSGRWHVSPDVIMVTMINFVGLPVWWQVNPAIMATMIRWDNSNLNTTSINFGGRPVRWQVNLDSVTVPLIVFGSAPRAETHLIHDQNHNYDQKISRLSLIRSLGTP